MESEAQHLEVGNIESPPKLGRLSTKLLRLRTVPADIGDVALVEGKPAVVGAGVQRLEHAPRPAKPAAGHGNGAVEVEVVGREPRSHAGRAFLISSLPVKTVSALARLEHCLRIIEPPRRPAETLKGFGRFTGR